VNAAFGRVLALTTDFKPLLQRIGVGLVRTTQERFLTAKDADALYQPV
jgi:hypothetical protein